MMAYLPPFVDEFTGETGKVTDCVPASGLMGVNKRTLGAKPATASEREALQAAMGTTNLGADAKQLHDGLLKRYGFDQPYGTAWAPIEAALLDPSMGVVIFGSYPKLPLALRQHGRQPTFSGLHAVYAQSLDPAARTTIIGDPLATSYYSGVRIDDLKAYCAGLSYMYVTFKEEDVTTITQDSIPLTQWSTKVGDLYGYKIGAPPKKTTWSRASDAATDAIVSKVDPLPAGWPSGPFLRVTNGAYAEYMVPLASVTFTAPDPCAPIRLELSQAKAQLAAANSRISTAKTALG